MSTSVSSDWIIALETGKCQQGMDFGDAEVALEMAEGEERSLNCGRDDTLRD
jgi:hypothetical protein